MTSCSYSGFGKLYGVYLDKSTIDGHRMVSPGLVFYMVFEAGKNDLKVVPLSSRRKRATEIAQYYDIYRWWNRLIADVYRRRLSEGDDYSKAWDRQGLFFSVDGVPLMKEKDVLIDSYKYGGKWSSTKYTLSFFKMSKRLIQLLILIGIITFIVWISFLGRNQSTAIYIGEIKAGYKGVVVEIYFDRSKNLKIKTEGGDFVQVGMLCSELIDSVDVGDTIEKIPNENYVF